MPVDVAVEEPRARVIGGEAEGNLVTSDTSGNHVAEDGVVPVVIGAPCAANDPEVVLKIEGSANY